MTLDLSKSNMIPSEEEGTERGGGERHLKPWTSRQRGGALDYRGRWGCRSRRERSRTRTDDGVSLVQSCDFARIRGACSEILSERTSAVARKRLSRKLPEVRFQQQPGLLQANKAPSSRYHGGAYGCGRAVRVYAQFR